LGAVVCSWHFAQMYKVTTFWTVEEREMFEMCVRDRVN